MAALPQTYTGMGKEISHCLKLCQECHNVCVETFTHSLQRELLPETDLRIIQDCAEICQTTANFLLRGSTAQAQISGTCAEICLKCVSVCETVAEDSRFQECANSCRACAEACQTVLALTMTA